MIREVHLHSSAPPATLDAWRDWFHDLGIDPNRVPVPCTIVVDDTAGTLTWPEYAVDDDGAVWLADDITGEIVPTGSFARPGDGELHPVRVERHRRFDQPLHLPGEAAR